MYLVITINYYLLLIIINNRNQNAAAHYSWKTAESLMRSCRKRSLPPLPNTLRELADQFESNLLNRYQTGGELIFKGNITIIIIIKVNLNTSLNCSF